MLLKTELIDHLIDCGIQNFAIIAENVLHFHADADDYYQQWKEDISGEIFIINALSHVLDELQSYKLHYYLSFGGSLNEVNWRVTKPDLLLDLLEIKYLDC